MQGNPGSNIPVKKIIYTFAGILIIAATLIFISRLIFPGIEISADPKERYNLEAIPVTLAEGINFSYNITFPADKWFARDHESAVQDSPETDLWITDPEKDAHVIISGAKIDSSLITMDIYRDSVLGNYDESGYDYSISENFPLTVNNEEGYYMEISVKLEESSADYYYGLFIRNNQLLQVLCFMNSVPDQSDKETFRQIIKSFRFTG